MISHACAVSMWGPSSATLLALPLAVAQVCDILLAVSAVVRVADAFVAWLQSVDVPATILVRW